MLKDVRIPGVLWAFVLVVLVGLIHEYEASLPLDPQVIDLVVLIIIGVLKGLSLGTEQLNHALDVIDEIRRTAGSNRARGSAAAPAGVEDTVVLSLAASAPPRPNNIVRWFVG